MTNKTEVKIRSILDSVIEKKGFDPSDITDDDDLLKIGAIDSLDIVNVICEISDTLKKSVDISSSSTIINKKWFFDAK